MDESPTVSLWFDDWLSASVWSGDAPQHEISMSQDERTDATVPDEAP